MKVSENKVSQWLSTLPQDLQQQLRALHRPVKKWRFIIIAFIGIWITAGWFSCMLPYWPIRLLGYIVIGSVIHALAICMHECAHGNMFRNSMLDHGVGFLLGIPALMSITAYQVTHRLHHKYNRSPRDPDEFTNLSNNQRILSIAFYVWALLGMPLYLVHIAITALARGNTKQRWTVIVEESLIIGLVCLVVAVAAKMGYFSVLLHCWLIPIVFAMLMANTRAWSEHTMTLRGHPLTQSRTVISNRLVALFLCNQNYHLEHHLFPAIPWYRLPTVHNLLQEEYRRANIFIYKSYLRFMWDAYRGGVHSELPNPINRMRFWQQGMVK